MDTAPVIWRPKPLNSSWPGVSQPSRLARHCRAPGIEIAGTSPAMTSGESFRSKSALVRLRPVSAVRDQLVEQPDQQPALAGVQPREHVGFAFNEALQDRFIE